MEESDTNQKPPKKRAKSRTRRNVTFELPANVYQALQEDAALRGLDSLHQRGREVVIDYLNNQSAEEIAERLSAVEQEIVAFREDLSHLEKLLRRLAYVTIAVSQENENDETKARQCDKANEWVKRNMPAREARR